MGVGVATFEGVALFPFLLLQHNQNVDIFFPNMCTCKNCRFQIITKPFLYTGILSCTYAAYAFIKAETICVFSCFPTHRCIIRHCDGIWSFFFNPKSVTDFFPAHFLILLWGVITPLSFQRALSMVFDMHFPFSQNHKT